MDFTLILNILLLPKKFYKKINDKKPSLYLGIVAVGMIDIIFTLVENYRKIFYGKPALSLYFNVTLMIVLILLLGFIDVLFFSLPLFDLFKRFKKEKDLPGRGAELPKLMKIYILANLLVFPANLMISFVDSSKGAVSDNLTLYIISLLVIVWFSAVISRGINVIYNFQPMYSKLVFLVVYIWNLLLGYAILYITQNWITKMLS